MGVWVSLQLTEIRYRKVFRTVKHISRVRSVAHKPWLSSAANCRMAALIAPASCRGGENCDK